MNPDLRALVSFNAGFFEENILKRSMGIIAVTYLLGWPTLVVHAANKSGVEEMAPTRLARSPIVTEAWARATVPGQPVGAVYMKIGSPFHVTLTEIESDVAASAEIHSMRMQNGVMQMRALNQLDIPAGKDVELASGGMHLMLFGLKKPLKAGETIRLKMIFVNDNKTKITLPLNVPIRPFGG